MELEKSFYDICTDFFKDREEVSAAAFYRELFPEGELQRRDESHNYKYNAIACEISTPVRRYTLGNDLEHLDELLQSENFVIMSPISYVGKKHFRSVDEAEAYIWLLDINGFSVMDL